MQFIGESDIVFQEAMQFIREGDQFIVEAIDRLGRNYDEIIQTVNFLKQKNVHLIITSLPIIGEVIRNPLFNKFIKDLIIQVLVMIAEQERNESKRRESQGIAIAKEKGVFKVGPVLYSSTAQDPQKRLVYYRVASQLKEEKTISHIAKEVDITRQTVYRIKKELN